MQTREAPDFWGLHKNKNCAFPLKHNTFIPNKLYKKKKEHGGSTYFHGKNYHFQKQRNNN